MPHYKAKVDANQPTIVKDLRNPNLGLQLTVDTIHTLGQGRPDIMVGIFGFNYLIEIKGPAGYLTNDERNWHQRWHGSVTVSLTASDVLKFVYANMLTNDILTDERKQKLEYAIEILEVIEEDRRVKFEEARRK